MLLVFGASCAYLRLFYDYSILNADEGIVLQGAQRILRGQVLYRDFFSFVTPGSYYWMALLFKIFGSSVLVGRALLVVYGGLFSALTYLLARRVCPRWSALLASYAVTLTCLPFRFVVLHNWDSTLLAYLTLYFAVRSLESLEARNSKLETRKLRIPAKAGTSLWALATGSFASLTFLFEHSKGAGLMLGLLAGFAVIVWRGRNLRQQSTVDRQESKIGSTGYRDSADWPPPSAQSGEGSPAAYCLLPTAYCLLAGLAWPFTLVLTYFAVEHSLVEMLRDWAWPAFHYSLANRLPYGFLVMSTANRTTMFSGPWGVQLVILLVMGTTILLPILPIIALAAFIWGVLKGPSGQPWSKRRSYAVLVSAILCGLLCSVVLTKRPDFTHLNYLAPLFYQVLAWALDGLDLRSRLWHAVMPVVAFLAFFSFTAFGLAMLWGPLRAHQKFQTARGTIRTGEPDRALEYVQAHTRRGETIFVYPYEPLYYYLTATFSASRFDFLQPGMHSSEQLDEVAREIARGRPRVVLFESDFADKIALAWPNTPAELIAARDPVADYLFAHYRACSALAANGFWHFVYMVRKGDNCPEGEAGLRSR